MKKLKFVKSILLLTGVVYIFLFIINEGKINKVQAQTSSTTQSSKDSDFDGLADEAEINVYHTNPNMSDTDKDGFLDSAEVLAGSDPLVLNTTIDGVPTKTPVAKNAFDFSKLPWYLARSAGNTSFGLMFLIILLGTGMTTGLVYELITPMKAWNIHKYLSISLGLTLLVHVVSLLFDRYMNFQVVEILVPFVSRFKPLSVGLGITGFYLMLIMVLSSLLIRLKYPFFWRYFHYAVYPMFIFSFLHGVLTGTDSSSWGMQIVYWVTGLIYVSLLVYRFIFYKLNKRA